MVSQETTSDTTSSSLHQFLSSSSPINYQTQFETQTSNSFGSVQSLGERISRSLNLVQADESEMGHHSRHVIDLLGAPNEANSHTNRLSSSLGSQGLIPSLHHRQSCLISGEETCTIDHTGCMGGESSFTAFAPFPSASRYLRPAQLLLEEVVDTGGKAVELTDLKRLFLSSSRGASSSELRAELLSFTGSLSADKHELQIQMLNLVALLEQLESRYEEYCHRMEQVISSFEVITGEGAAKTYTALALQAMSKHFCSLREAILAQIKVSRKKLSPELPKMKTGLSQLSLLHTETSLNRIRQESQPIRGLPQTSVAILRSWLFEHFLHPYPNYSEKLILASQTGLSKNQVSNWFINARVRLWKPMIEEIYKEEFGECSPEG